MTRIAPFAEIDTVISDISLNEEIQAKLRALGCNLILVQQGLSGSTFRAYLTRYLSR